MSLDRRLRAGLLSGASVLLAGGSAFAQVEATAATTADAPAPPAAPSEPAPAPAAEPAPAATAAAGDAAPAEAKPPEEAAESLPTGLTFMLFADAYAGYQTAQTGTPGPWHHAYELNNLASGQQNGFGLSWLGLDAAYNTKHFGVTGSLRFGSAVPIYYAADTGGLGIENITQAYVTVRPVEGLDIDLGQFYTIYGAEVAESWRNMNYTRGGLNYGFQPFWHTGARVTYQLGGGFVAKALVVNPVNQIVLDGGSVNAGLQLGYTNETFGVFLGGLAALDESINTGPFDRFFDLVATASFGDLGIVFNGDLGINTRDAAGASVNNAFWGLSLAARYALSEQFGIAARGEYLKDEDGIYYGAKTGVVTGTLTLDYKPTPNVVLRWDNRIETADTDIYFNGDGAATGNWFESVVGAVVHTEGLLK